jgi:integrase
MVERAAQAAGFDMKIHPHMLRHACGYKLANEKRRYPHNPGLFGSQVDPAHGALHRGVTHSV